MSIDLIPSDQLRKSYIHFLKVLDERIQNPKEQDTYQHQISLILSKIVAMKEVGTAYVKLDEGQQEIIQRLLEKELQHDVT